MSKSISNTNDRSELSAKDIKTITKCTFLKSSSLLLMSIFCMFCAFFWEVTDESPFAFLKFTCGVGLFFFLLARTFNKHVKSKNFQSTSYVKKDFCPPAHFPDNIYGQFWIYVILGLAKIKDFQVEFGQVWNLKKFGFGWFGQIWVFQLRVEMLILGLGKFEI